MLNNEIKTVYLTYQVIKQNDKGQKHYEKPIIVSFSYSEYFGKIPISVIIDKLDEVYAKLKKQLMEELENDR